MSNIFEYSNPIISEMRDVFAPVEQPAQIVEGHFILQELPDKFNRVQITSTSPSVDWIETNDPKNIGEDEYYVDYAMGAVYFHSSRDSMNVVASFYGRGLAFMPASRIWTRESGGNVEETLQDILTGAMEFVYKGIYDASLTYYKYNMVTYNGGTYQAIMDVPAGIDPTNSEYWAKISNFSFKGVYDSNVTYINGDFVVDSNLTTIYLCITETSLGDPLTDTSAWLNVIDVSDIVARLETLETDVSDAETIRISNENQRIQNESDREENEDARKSAENTRQSQESTRQSNEQDRVSQEIVREDNEANRITNESTRESNEADRESAENARISAENIRIQSELERESNETTRETNEDERITNETGRVSAESTRESNEQDRIDAEQIRESNESTRQQQEQQRQTNTAQAISDAEDATNEALQAADNAQDLVDTYIHMGEYDNSTAYVVNNAVRFDGSTYRCIQDSQGNPPTDGNYWILIARRGVDGSGSVSSVNNVSPDVDGNVELSPEDIGAESTSNKGQPDGYASLDTTGNIPSSQLGNVEPMEVHGNEWHSEEFETVQGAQDKANTAEENAKEYTDDELEKRLIISNEEPTENLFDMLYWYNPDTFELKVYIDGEFRSAGSGNMGLIPRLNTVLVSNETNTIDIGIPEYDYRSDILMVFINSTFIQKDEDYILSSNGQSIEKVSGNWNGTDETITFNFMCIQGIPLDVQEKFLATVRFNNTVEITSNNTTEINIGIPEYDKNLDIIDVTQHGNLPLVENVNYTVSEDSKSINLIGYTVNQGEKFTFYVWKKVRVAAEDVELDGQFIKDKSVSLNKLADDVHQKFEAENIAIADNDNHFTSTNVEGALSELFTNVNSGKTTLAAAIVDMGQSALGSMTFAQLATAIKNISDDANATTGQVLSGRTFYQGGAIKTGTMPNNGALGTITPSATSKSIPAGYTTGGTVAGDSNLVSGNIRKGATLFDVEGIYTGISRIIHDETSILANETGTTVSITPSITTSRSIIFITGLRGSTETIGAGANAIGCEISSSTQARFDRQFLGQQDITIAYTIIEFAPGISVSRGSYGVSSTSHNIYVGSFDPSKTFLLSSWSTAEMFPNNVHQQYILKLSESNNQLTFSQVYGFYRQIYYQIIKFP